LVLQESQIRRDVVLRSHIAKSAAVVLLGSLALATPERADASAYFPWCNEWLPGPCSGWDSEDLQIACSGLCPQYFFAYCHTETGEFFCQANES
jgi:hypothetical protein